MNALHDDLADFARAIVDGVQPLVRFGVSPHYTAATGIEVYRNNYRGNLQDALASAYPVIEQLVGAEFFRMLARDFIVQHSSRSANLSDYGAALGDLLSGYAPAQPLPYLPDVAKLEWACHLAYFAADAASLDLTRLSQVAPDDYENLLLHVHPACRIVSSNYPIVAIWQAHQSGADSLFKIDLASGAEIALVNRQDDAVNVRELTEEEAYWLEAVIHGQGLGTATAATLERFPAFDLQDALLLFASLDAWTDFTLGEPA